MGKPTVYDELYPGRFLKAGLLKGQKVTLTIKDVDLEGLEDENGKKQQKAILTFEERPMQLVMCKTNGFCIKSMFGATLSAWVGKRVTLYEDSWNGEPCIRVWGSPNIQKDAKVTIQLPRRRPMDRILHAVKSGRPTQSGAVSVEPRLTAAFEVLGWAADKQMQFLADNHGTLAEQLTKLNDIIDEKLAAESA